MLTLTTLSAAVNATQTSVPLASGTGVAIGSFLWCDSELINITSVSAPQFSVTNPAVQRGYGGTQAKPHVSGSPISVGLPSDYPENRNAGQQHVFAGRNDVGRYRDYSSGLLAAWASTGTDSFVVVGTTFVTDIYIDRSRLVTGIGVLLGSVSGAGHGVGILYDKYGTVLGSTSAATATSGTVNAFQQFPLLAPVVLTGPDIYFVGYQGDNAADKVRLLPAAAASVESCFQITGGTFGSTPPISPVIGFTTNVGPIVYFY